MTNVTPRAVEDRQLSMLCIVPARTDPRAEDVDAPTLDIAQEAWLLAFESLHKQGKSLPPASNPNELRAAYKEHAPLLSLTLMSARVNARRTRHGSARNMHAKKILSFLRSLDQPTAEGGDRTLLELIPDPDADVPFLTIEDLDELRARIDALPEKHKVAVRHYAQAWLIAEAGHALPNTTRKRISRDRSRTGLALALQPGPK